MGKKDSQVKQDQITDAQLGILQEQNQLQRQNYERSQQLLQPSIDRYSALASGDRSKVLSAIAPQIANIDTGFSAARDSIFDSIAPGAARDYALANLERGRATSKAGYQNEAVVGSFDKLANIASGLGAFSLQELGAALRGGEGASQSNSSLMQNEAARKQAQMGFFGDVARAAGGVGFGFTPGGKSGSDRRLKVNIQPLREMLAAVMKIQPCTFDFRSGPKGQIGVIAQELLAVVPQLVSMNQFGYYLVDYGAMAAVCVAAIQELSAEVERLRTAPAA